MARKQSRDPDVALTWSPGGSVVSSVSEASRAYTTGTVVYGTSLGLSSRASGNIVRTLKRGLSVSSFETLQVAMAISAAELAACTNIAVRTLSRRKQEGRLHKDESERLYRIGALFDRATEVLGSRESARHWFKTPKRALAGASPLEYADTEPGAREVESLLGRLEHGVFS